MTKLFAGSASSYTYYMYVCICDLGRNLNSLQAANETIYKLQCIIANLNWSRRSGLKATVLNHLVLKSMQNFIVKEHVRWNKRGSKFYI